jgi:hypothetical protein
VKEIEDGLDLVHRIGWASLLAVTKGSIRDHELVGRVDGDDLVIKVDPAYLLVREDPTLQIGLRHILQLANPESRVLVVEDSLVLIPAHHTFLPSEVSLPVNNALPGETPLRGKIHGVFREKQPGRMRKNSSS